MILLHVCPTAKFHIKSCYLHTIAILTIPVIRVTMFSDKLLFLHTLEKTQFFQWKLFPILWVGLGQIDKISPAGGFHIWGRSRLLICGSFWWHQSATNLLFVACVITGFVWIRESQGKSGKSWNLKNNFKVRESSENFENLRKSQWKLEKDNKSQWKLEKDYKSQLKLEKDYESQWIWET